MPSIIKIQNLSKKYRISHEPPVNNFREKLTSEFSRIFHLPRKNKLMPQSNTEDLWALKNISLSVNKGEVIGLIGSNGSGKSTLLKILAGILIPTSGIAKISGTVASLLEAGAGFHDQLTGRENVYLSGVLLGMKRREVEAKFSQIVAFSGVEKFLDTPVKYYSSGMYVRLGFSVNVYLDMDILLIDEVLSVGDTDFKSRSFAKISQLIKNGKTIVIVSHDMDAINKLCHRVYWLDCGQILASGKPDEIISRYLNA